MDSAGAARAAAPPVLRRDRLFVWIAALSPLNVVFAVGLFGGTALAARWGTNAFLLSGHIALLVVPRAFKPHRLVRAACWIVLPLQVLLCVGKTVGADRLAIPTRTNFPGAALEQLARTTWQRNAGPTAGPLRLIASDSWLGGNLILHADGQRRYLLIDGSRRNSP